MRLPFITAALLLSISGCAQESPPHKVAMHDSHAAATEHTTEPDEATSAALVVPDGATEPNTPTVKPADDQHENPSASPAHEQLDLSSADGVTAALEKRWSLGAIKTFCIPERRDDGIYQNLVADEGETWKGELYENEETGFDSITWYGTAVDGKLRHYSLNVNRGHDWWSLEIGGAESFNTPPDASPDPSHPRFVGGKRRHK